MQSVSPVFTDEEVGIEHVLANDSKDLLQVIGLTVSLQVVDRESKQIKILENWGTSIRFRLSDEERALVTRGGDLVVTQLNLGKSIVPLNIQICADRVRPVFAAAVDAPTAEEIEAAKLDIQVETQDAKEAKIAEGQFGKENNVIEMPRNENPENVPKKSEGSD